MRALTLIQPMAAAIVHGTKRIENRPRALPKSMQGVETVVAVHAGKCYRPDYEFTCDSIDGVPKGPHNIAIVPYQKHVHNEGIVGLMLLSGRMFTQAPSRPFPPPTRGMYFDPWFGGPYGYEILAAIAFPGPIPCRGMQGWWPLPKTIEDIISMSDAVVDLYEQVGR
jgi:hypothetical protein